MLVFVISDANVDSLAINRKTRRWTAAKWFQRTRCAPSRLYVAFFDLLTTSLSYFVAQRTSEYAAVSFVQTEPNSEKNSGIYAGLNRVDAGAASSPNYAPVRVGTTETGHYMTTFANENTDDLSHYVGVDSIAQ